MIPVLSRTTPLPTDKLRHESQAHELQQALKYIARMHRRWRRRRSWCTREENIGENWAEWFMHPLVDGRNIGELQAEKEHPVRPAPHFQFSIYLFSASWVFNLHPIPAHEKLAFNANNKRNFNTNNIRNKPEDNEIFLCNHPPMFFFSFFLLFLLWFDVFF